MPSGYQIKSQESAYYLTFQIVFWIDIFSRKVYRDIIIESLRHCQQHKGLGVFAYVIMSNHVHLLVRAENGNLSDIVRDFKKFTSKEIIKAIENGTESRKEWMLKLFQYAAKRQKKR